MKNKLWCYKIFLILSKKTTFEVRKDHFVQLFWLFVFFCVILFPSELWNRLFRGPRNTLRNEQFFPRNNGIHSESIPRNFFGTKFRCQPYLELFPIIWRSSRFSSLLLLSDESPMRAPGPESIPGPTCCQRKMTAKIKRQKNVVVAPCAMHSCRVCV